MRMRADNRAAFSIQTLLLWLCAAILTQCITARSVHNYHLRRIEPVAGVSLDIAPRPSVFFEKRQLSPNPIYKPAKPHSIEYDDILRLSLVAYNQTFRLHLHPNTEIFHPEAVIFSGGKHERVRPQDYRLYRGHVISEQFTESRWMADKVGLVQDDPGAGSLGWARITIRHDLKHDLDFPLVEGVFQVREEMYHVKVTQNYRLTKRSIDPDLAPADKDAHMVIYRQSDTVRVPMQRRDGSTEPGHCQFDDLLLNQPQRNQGNEWGVLEMDHLSNNPFSALSLGKRAPAGCPSVRKVLYMGAAADCTYTSFYQSEASARTQILSDWSSVSAVYESSFNIQLGLINITTMSPTCPSAPAAPFAWNRACSTSYTIVNRLSDFSQWRGTLGDDGAGLWHLMTACASGVEIGVAWSSVLCETGAISSANGGTTSGTGVSSITLDEWKVVAHEIGHNFGALHDCTAETCTPSGPSNCCQLSATECDAKGAYLMNPSSNSSSNSFSPCTINQVCSFVQSSGSCLQDPGTRTVTTTQMCGNGIKETGEDCDPGGVDNACCDAATCRFKANAQCDDATDLCCEGCQIRNASYVCRPATTECDIPETCPGNSGDCPRDSYKTDGESCSNGRQCASGQCTSRDDQCRARAADMGVTRACSADASCQIICDRPHSLSCYIFNGFFLDGTPCGIGGVCKNGSCDTGNFLTNAKNWIDNHKQVVIPVAVVLGLLLLLCISRCIYYGCCGYAGYRAARAKDNGVYVVSSGAPPPYQPYYPPPPPSQYVGDQRPSHWVDPTPYNAMPPSTPVPSTTPPAPPQSYTPAGRGPEPYDMDNNHAWHAENAALIQNPHPEEVKGSGGRA